MDKREINRGILENVLSGFDIKIADVLEKVIVPIDERTSVYFYTSHYEGLGNAHSDIDVYVISDYDLPHELPYKYFNCDGVSSFTINGLTFDIEYWKEKEINNLITLANSSKGGELDIGLLKILLRLSYSYYIKGNESNIPNQIEEMKINEYVTNRYLLMGRSFYDDAVKMFKLKNYIACLDCCRQSLWNVIGAYNSKNGHANLKEKWISRIFISNKGSGNSDFLDRYYQFQVYSSITEETIEEFVEEFLDFIQDVMSNIML